jgi:hypothetical protein
LPGLLQVLNEAALYFNQAPVMLAYSDSRKADFLEAPPSHDAGHETPSTSTNNDKIAALFNRDVSAITRALNKARARYALYDDFRRDTDAILESLRQKGLM